MLKKDSRKVNVDLLSVFITQINIPKLLSTSDEESFGSSRNRNFFKISFFRSENITQKLELITCNMATTYLFNI